MAPPIAEGQSAVTNGAAASKTNGSTKFDDITITGFYSKDIRFPVGLEITGEPSLTDNRQTSLQDEGSDAMNGAVDFSNPYVVLKTNSEHEGHGVVSMSLG